MKKTGLFIGILLLFTFSLSAKKDKEDFKTVLVKEATSDNYYYEGVIPVEGVSKEEMFERAKSWVLKNLKTGDNNIFFDDKNMEIGNTATIVMKAGHGFNWAITGGLINFKLNLQFKDGRYKFRFDNIAVQAAYADGIVETLNYNQVQRNNAVAKFIRRDANEKIESIKLQLENAIKNGGDDSKDDW